MQNSLNKTNQNFLVLLNDKSYIEQKRLAFQWVLNHFESVAAEAENQLAGKIPKIFNAVKPKISKGEAHDGLPFIVLDYPAIFQKEHILAIRTIFIWGEPIQITLFMKGSFIHQFKEPLLNYTTNNDLEEYLSMADSPWKHTQEKANWQLVNSDNLKQAIQSNQFIKLGVFCDLDELANLSTLFVSTCQRWFKDLIF